jgi:FMN phosphatase YigB (HAD superfamily)
MFDNVTTLMLDWGGTLVDCDREADVRRDCARAFVASARDAGVAIHAAAESDFVRRYIEGLADRKLDQTLREFDLPELMHHWAADHGLLLAGNGNVDKILLDAWRPWVGCLDPIGDIVATISRLKRGGLRLGLVSNCATPRTLCERELNRLGLTDLLDFALFSSEIGLRKPHERIYEVALDRSATHPAAVLFVGDTPAPDVEGPARAGMRTALVRTGRWDGDPAALTHPPDAIIDSVHDLPTLLEID